MAGKTMIGIGKGELDKSSAAPNEPEHTPESGPTVVDGARIEEALRNLRSPEEILGTRTTAPNGPPAAADPAAPAPVNATAPPSNSDRVSLGTMVGHEIHHLAPSAEALAAARGTSVGHDVHLASQLGGRESIPGVAATSTVADPAAPIAEAEDFSGGDHSFFDTEPVNTEYEPENPRAGIYARLAVFGAVAAVVAVVGIAWLRSHDARRAEEAEDAPAATYVPPPVSAHRNVEPPTSIIPSSIPVAMPATPAPVPAPPAPSLSAPEPSVAAAPAPVRVRAPAPPPPSSVAEEAPAPPKAVAVRAHKPSPPPVAAEPRPPAPPPPPLRADKPKAAPIVARAKPPAAAPPYTGAAAPHPTLHPSSPPPSADAAMKPARNAGGKRVKRYDPDGTLPLSFD